ncbi:MAG: hypothetical protein IT522_04720 [Burkholderiales bacterium]|nr:hypothetical protein [Burkholderiales bacterium]
MKRAVTACLAIGMIALLAARNEVSMPPATRADASAPVMAVAALRSVRLVFPH